MRFNWVGTATSISTECFSIAANVAFASKRRRSTMCAPSALAIVQVPIPVV